MILDCVTTIGESHMSRTYRRKNSEEEFEYTYEFEVIFDRGGSFLTWRRFLEGAELKRSLAMFHSDSDTFNWDVPTDYRRARNRERRSKNKAILARAVHNINDEPMFNPNLKDVRYDYW